MTCIRCGAEYDRPTDIMKKHRLCINCVMEWHRGDKTKPLKKFREEKRESHFKL